MTNREWFTAQLGPAEPFGTDLSDVWRDSVGISGFRPDTGDTLTHFLLEWHFFTPLIENSTSLDLQPWPIVAGVSYSPEVGESAPWDALGDGGDALVTVAPTWERESWTDGTTFSSKWVARSLVPLYSNTSRDIVDRSTDEIRFSAAVQRPDNFRADLADWFRASVLGWMRLRYLIIEKHA
jgi:hypothetical protein